MPSAVLTASDSDTAEVFWRFSLFAVPYTLFFGFKNLRLLLGCLASYILRADQWINHIPYFRFCTSI